MAMPVKVIDELIKGKTKDEILGKDGLAPQHIQFTRQVYFASIRPAGGLCFLTSPLSMVCKIQANL